MRTFITTILMTSTLGAAAYAQGRLEPAPVPNRELSQGAPADRAGRPDGADNAAPFSGLPTGVIAGSGQATPSTVGTPQKDAGPTPSLSR